MSLAPVLRARSDAHIERLLTKTLESQPADGARFRSSRSHDYERHGTTLLLAALDVKTAKIIGERHRRHRAEEFRKFPYTIDSDVPRDINVHLIVDNYSTHKTPLIRRWLAKRPRCHVHSRNAGPRPFIWTKVQTRSLKRSDDTAERFRLRNTGPFAAVAVRLTLGRAPGHRRRTGGVAPHRARP